MEAVKAVKVTIGGKEVLIEEAEARELYWALGRIFQQEVVMPKLPWEYVPYGYPPTITGDEVAKYGTGAPTW